MKIVNLGYTGKLRRFSTFLGYALFICIDHVMTNLNLKRFRTLKLKINSCTSYEYEKCRGAKDYHNFSNISKFPNGSRGTCRPIQRWISCSDACMDFIEWTLDTYFSCDPQTLYFNNNSYPKQVFFFCIVHCPFNN